MTRETAWTGGVTHACSADLRARTERNAVSYTIFEGTSEIQRLVVARAISGLHIP
jgi:alkylation response protein AidB-like acyl-CoA dehydrogenase